MSTQNANETRERLPRALLPHRSLISVLGNFEEWDQSENHLLDPKF